MIRKEDIIDKGCRNYSMGSINLKCELGPCPCEKEDILRYVEVGVLRETLKELKQKFGEKGYAVSDRNYIAYEYEGLEKLVDDLFGVVLEDRE